MMIRKPQAAHDDAIRLGVGLVLVLAVGAGHAELREDVGLSVDKMLTAVGDQRSLQPLPSYFPRSLQLASNEVPKKSARDALFDDDALNESSDEPIKTTTSKSDESSSSGLKGYFQIELAHTTGGDAHWSKMRTRADLGSQGNLGNGIKWKLGARVDYDAVYDHRDYYPGAVERDQRFNVDLRENYVDFGSGDWDFRLGKQHVVWGEMVGLFFADVVSARDMREFILPEFDTMRIPQWAARAEYFKDNFHAELLWIPLASYDRIGKPGGEFYPEQPRIPGYDVIYRNEDFPERRLSNGNYGLRLSGLTNGWDMSAFVYRSMDNSATFYRDGSSLPGTLIYQARHDRINQLGGTLSKDFGSVVLKAESVYTGGRHFGVARLTDSDGVVAQNTLDWAVGLDFSLPADTRLNMQVFERYFVAHDADLFADRREDGYSLLLNRKFGDRLEVQALWIASLNRTDWLFRPRLVWSFERNWRLTLGADVFRGPALGVFGRYDGSDRVYSEVRYSF